MSKTPHAIVCSATLNPGGADCQVSIQWGADTNYGTVIPCDPVKAGWDDVPIGGTIPNLDGSTIVHWRFVSVNSVGETDGDDVVDTTLPDVAELSVISNEVGTVS